MDAVNVESLTKKYGPKEVLKGVNLKMIWKIIYSPITIKPDNGKGPTSALPRIVKFSGYGVRIAPPVVRILIPTTTTEVAKVVINGCIPI